MKKQYETLKIEVSAKRRLKAFAGANGYNLSKAINILLDSHKESSKEKHPH